MKQEMVFTTVGRKRSIIIKRYATTIGVGLLGLIFTLLVVRAAIFGQGLPATPAGVDEWTPLGGPTAEGGQINDLAVHPDEPGIIYAAVAPVGVNAWDFGPSTIYKTTDGATSWEPVHAAERQVHTLAAAGTRVYAGAFNREGEGPSIYVSGDSGLTWTAVYSFTQRGVWLDASIHPSDPNTAVLGGWLDDGTNVDQAIVYRTDDGGLTWGPILTATAPGEPGHVYAVLIHPVTPTIVLAAAHSYSTTNSIIYRSEDGGLTWPISETITDRNVISLAANSADSHLIYAGTGSNSWTWSPNSVLRSADAGISWELITEDTGGLVVIEPPETVYVLGNGVWASPDGGDSWELRQGHVPGPQNAFAIDLGTAPVALYMGGAFSGIAKSTNGGVDWSGENAGIETLVIPRDIAVDPQNNNKLFAAGECAGEGGWMSVDGGASWTAPTGLDGCIMAFTVNRSEPDVVYAGAMTPLSGAVLRSANGGLSFTPVYTAPYILPDGSGGQQTINDVAIANSNSETVYAVGWDSPALQGNSAMALRSLDDGASWTEVFTLPAHSWVYVLAIHPRDDSVVYIGGEDCHTGPGCHGFIYRTLDEGENWELVLTVTDTVRSIVIDPLQPNEVYMADGVYWVRKSTDGGDNWAVIRSPHWISGEPSGNKLAVDPYLSGHVYLGGWGYIAETRDGGATWSEWGDPLNTGTPPMEPSALAVDFGMDTQTLYAGFSGVWAHSRVGPLPWRVYLPIAFKSAP